MTSPDLLTPAEVAALFRVDPKTVTRWAKEGKLSSIRTVGGHRRYRACEIHELLNAERASRRYARLEALVGNHYDGDPTRALLDIADRYGLAVTALNRTWFTHFMRRDLTDLEWKRIAAELGDFGGMLHRECAGQLLDYVSTVLAAAGIPLPDTTASELPPLPTPDREDQDADVDVNALSPTTPLQPEQTSPNAGAQALSLDDVDRLVPHSARIWNYILGGNDHYEADRQAADTFQEVYPDLAHLVVSQRSFKRQAIEYLTKQKVRQFIDIGPGLPSPKDLTDTHVVAGSAARNTRTVYVDNDPLVSIRIRELLNSDPCCAANLVHADVADTEAVLVGAARHLDLDEPVAILLIGVMGHIDNTDDAHAIVRRLMNGLAPGSYLALSDATTTKTALVWAQETYNATGAAPYRLRTPTRIAEFFTGLSPVQPGLVPPALWQPSQPPEGGVNIDARCAVARTW
jgi:excisionase family DNA binding protein